MSRYSSNLDSGAEVVASGIGCLFIIFIWAVAIVISMFCIQYDVNFWMTYAGKPPVELPFVAKLLGAMFLSQFIIPVSVVTFILSFIL
jgi:hypothetical protein